VTGVAFLLMLSGAPSGWHDVVVESNQAGLCAATLDGTTVPHIKEDRSAADWLAAKGGKRPKAFVRLSPASGGGSAPYRCIGRVIYSLQMARYGLKIGFLSELPSR
jgi:hypothetical protein